MILAIADRVRNSYSVAFSRIDLLAPWAFHAAAFGVVGLCSLLFWSNSYILTDDAFIYFRVMEHLLRGNGPVYNPGDAFAPVTSILWAYAGCAAHTLLPFGLLMSVKVLSVALYLLTLMLLTDVVRTAVGDAAIFTAPALLSTPLFQQLVGLETFLALFAIALSMWAYFRARSIVLVSVCVAMGFFCRGDTVLVAIPLGVHYLFKAGLRKGIRDGLPALLVGSAVFGMGLIGHYWLTQTWLPPTMQTKMLQGAVGPWPTYASRALNYASGDPMILYPLAALGVLWMRWAGAVLLSTVSLHWVSYWLMGVAAYPWYAYQLLTLTCLAKVMGLCFGVWSIARTLVWLFRRRWPRLLGQRRIAAGVLAFLSVLPAMQYLGLLSQTRFRSFDVPWDPSGTVGEAGHMRTYDAVSQRILVDLEGSETERPVVLATEIGVIGYRCMDVTVRDVTGLATPNMDEATLGNWAALAERYDPDYLVMTGKRRERQVLPNAAYERMYAVQHPGHVGATLYRKLQ